MTKRIFRSIFMVSSVILGISICLVMGILYGYFGEQLEKELRQEAVYLSIAVEKDGAESLKALPKNSERVTLIDAEGTVLYDNKADAETMENHLDRKEVQPGRQDRAGESIPFILHAGAEHGLLCASFVKRKYPPDIQYPVFRAETVGRTAAAGVDFGFPDADFVHRRGVPGVKKSGRTAESSGFGSSAGECELR